MPLHAESVGTPATGRRKGGKSAQRVSDRMLNCQTYFGHRQHRPTRLPLPLPSASQRAPSSQKGRLAPATAVRYDLHSHARRRSHPCAPPSYVHAVDPLASAVANRSRRGGKDGYITTRTASLCGVRVCDAARARRRRGSHPRLLREGLHRPGLLTPLALGVGLLLLLRRLTRVGLGLVRLLDLLLLRA